MRVVIVADPYSQTLRIGVCEKIVGEVVDVPQAEVQRQGFAQHYSEPRSPALWVGEDYNVSGAFRIPRARRVRRPEQSKAYGCLPGELFFNGIADAFQETRWRITELIFVPAGRARLGTSVTTVRARLALFTQNSIPCKPT